MAEKRKRRKPWDRRKLPEVRAQMEVRQAYGIRENPEGLAHMIFWDCGGDWDKAAAWFEGPKVEPHIENYQHIRAYMFAPAKRALLEEIFAAELRLYQHYSAGREG